MPTLLQQRRATPAVRRRMPSARATKIVKADGEQLPIPEPGAGTRPKAKRSFVRRWMAAGLILATALLTVGFVANAIEVNDLLASINSVEAERDAVRRENERLRAELLRLMSVEQVTSRATELGMIQPDSPPIALHLNGAAEEKNESGTPTE